MSREVPPASPGSTPPGPGFPSTCWSRILAAPEAESQASRRALETLAEHYWEPVFAFVRRRWRRRDEEARDLTQEFFLWILQGDWMRKADPRRGRFRPFLKTCLDNFLRDQERSQKRLKRGGGEAPVSIDPSRALLDPITDDEEALTPEAALDRTWRRALLQRAVEELERELGQQGRQLQFQIFRDYYLNDTEELDYERLAKRYQVDKVKISNSLMAAKRKYRQVLRALVLETVESPEDYDAELRWLFDG